MKKDSFANYASNVFIQYAKLGYPTRSDVENKITDQVYLRHSGKSKLEKRSIAEQEIRKNESLLRDIEAVNIMLDMLSGRLEIPKEFNIRPADKSVTDVVDVLENVFFKNCRYNLNTKNLTLRVRRYAVSLPCDERTVWRSIRYAKHLFAKIRGLTTEWPDEIKISDENK